jgi:hypothetical protein
MGAMMARMASRTAASLDVGEDIVLVFDEVQCCNAEVALGKKNFSYHC